jgi:N-acetylglutamate synthase-like GNAT family acetyltransferase
MDPSRLLARLPAAELAYALFNARRTTTGDESLVSTGSVDGFAFIADRSRPRSAYYNRAACLSPDALTGAGLARLPEGVVAIELQPRMLTELAAAQLHTAGFHPAYSLCYLAAGDAMPPAPAQEVDVLRHAHVDEFLDALELEGVAFPPQRRAEKRRFYCTDTFSSFVIRGADGKPCAWSTMHVDEGVAFLGNTFTLPAHRRRGHHQALLAARLRHARERGIESVYTDVEHASQSHFNCERAGFRTVTVNTIWTRGA